MKICRHNFDGLGHCGIGGGADYCIEGPCVHEDMVELAPVQPDRWEGHADPIGALGCLPFCPVCRSLDMQWDHETDITTCGACGYRNTEEARENLAKRERNGEVTREKMMVSDEALKKLQEQIAAWPMAQRFTVQQLIESYLSDRQELRAYQSTGLTAGEVTDLQNDWSNLCTAVGECGGIDRVKELAEADKDGRLAVLPCKAGGSMLDMSDIERPEIMKRLHFAIAYVHCGIVFHRPYGIFLENVAAGHICPLSEEAEKALEANRNEPL